MYCVPSVDVPDIFLILQFIILYTVFIQDVDDHTLKNFYNVYLFYNMCFYSPLTVLPSIEIFLGMLLAVSLALLLSICLGFGEEFSLIHC